MAEPNLSEPFVRITPMLNELPLEHSLLTDRNIAIKLVGVGGAGSNATR